MTTLLRALFAAIVLLLMRSPSAAGDALFDPEAGRATAPLPSAAQYAIHLPGLSYHAAQTQAEGQRWNDRHPAVGFEQRMPMSAAGWDQWMWKTVAGTLQDSRDMWSLYAGAAPQRYLTSIDAYRVHGGAFTGLFYKSRNWRGDRVLLPVVMPSLSIEHRDGLGVNLLLFASRRPVAPILYGQLSYRFP